ncbi:MAG: hypothetical protein ACK5PS_05690 [Desulfopila sp.]
MDIDTVVLLILTAGAFGWWLSLGICEQRREMRAREKENAEQQKRQERLKKLFGRS